MVEEKRLSILRAILAMAWADGSFVERERKLMSELLKAFRPTLYEQKGLLKDPDPADTGRRLSLLLDDYDERLYCYQQALKMSYADGIVVDQEKKLLEQLKRSLDIHDDDAVEAEIAAFEISQVEKEEKNE